MAWDNFTSYEINKKFSFIFYIYNISNKNLHSDCYAQGLLNGGLIITTNINVDLSSIKPNEKKLLIWFYS